MKVYTDLRAGMTYEECDAQRNYWKQAAQTGNCQAVLSDMNPPTTPPPTTTTPPPTTGTTGFSCGYVNGVYYGDMSGTCG
jgi:hypothetical protein